MDITQDPKFKYFLRSKTREKNTNLKYIRDLTLFVECTGKTPSELIAEAREEQIKYPWMDERHLPTYFDEFIEFMDGKDQTKYSQKMTIASVKTFYHTFEVKTPHKNVKGHPESYYLLYEDLPQHDSIRKVIVHSNIQYRALFSFMASSAMNYSDATSISVRELILAVNYYFKITKNEEMQIKNVDGLYEIVGKKEAIVPVWRMWRFKTGNEHITFSSPESLKFIVDYFQDQPPENEDVAIFRLYKKQKTLTYGAMNRYLQDKNEKLGWKDKKVGAFNFVTSKSFRTFFANEMEDAEVNYKHIRLMMGHHQAGVTQNYFKSNAKKMLKSYLKGVNRLTFMENLQIVDYTDEKVSALEAELKKRDKADKAKDREIQQLRRDVDRALQIQKMEENLTKKMNQI